MTATGFLFIIVALFLSKVFGTGDYFKDNWWDKTAAWLFLAGLLNVIVGVSLFLYKVMP